MYSFSGRVRYSETDERGFLSLTALLNYLQDCTTFQSEDLGIGVEFLKRERRAWLLAAWEIQIPDLPKLGDPVVISTIPYAFKGIYGNRCFSITSPDGHPYVLADSLWFLYDTENNIPARTEERFVAPYRTSVGERLQMPPMDRKIRIPAGGRAAAPVIVGSQHLDTNHHVNNAQYVEIAREAAREMTGTAFKIGALTAQYKKMAFLGDEIRPVVHDTGDGVLVDLQDTQGGSFAVVRITKLA